MKVKNHLSGELLLLLLHLLSAALVPAQDVESVTERPAHAGPCVACSCDRAEVRCCAEESQTVRAGRGKR